MMASCSFRIDKKKPNQQSNIALSEEPISFAMVSAQIFRPSCMTGSCHPGEFASYQQVTSGDNLRRIEEQVLSLKEMPPAPPKGPGPLSPQLQNLLASWIDQGAPEFANASQPELPPDSIEAKRGTFEYVLKNVFEKKACLNCHVSGGKREESPLDSAEAIFNPPDPEIKLIDFENPKLSYLYTKSDPNDEFDGDMPPSKVRKRVGAVTEEQLAILLEWINLEILKRREKDSP